MPLSTVVPTNFALLPEFFVQDIAEFFHEDVTGTVKDRDAELLRQFHRLGSRGQEEVLDFMQFKLQMEDKINTGKKGN